MDSSAAWNSQDPTLSIPSQDDFQQFLNMGINGLGDGLQFEFPDFNQQGQGGQMIQQDDEDAMDTGMDDGRDSRGGQDTTMQEHMPAMTTATSHPSIHSGTLGHGHSTSSEVLSDIDAQIQYLQQQRHQQQQRQIQEQRQQLHDQHRNFYAQNRMIPPTPNSVEMHGATGQFFSPSESQQQAIYDRYRMQVKDQDVSARSI